MVAGVKGEEGRIGKKWLKLQLYTIGSRNEVFWKLNFHKENYEV